MVFSSSVFLFAFLPVTLLGYRLLRGRGRNIWLLIMSLIFFGWSQPSYLWIILASILVNYTGARFIARAKAVPTEADGAAASPGRPAGKAFLACTITANLLLLFYFKYFTLFMETLDAVAKRDIPVPEIILPIGISFFTFQGMSYVIDVYRGDTAVQKNILDLALYITLFPQLIAGPIVRYRDIEPEIRERSVSLDDFTEGISRFIVGLGKKVLIANTMAEIADPVWNAGALHNMRSVAWFAAAAYMLQIYFDFSGYSDMAIGLGRMFGFHFRENFDMPYISKSVTEFWRRWHISLSSWFRDYVYIPLGGNRKHVYRNLIVVFLLTAMWHGAAWHFLIWGIWHAVFLLLERAFRGKRSGLSCGKGTAALKTGLTLFVIGIGWVFFRAPDTAEAFRYLGVMFGAAAPEKPGFTLLWYLRPRAVTMFLAGCVISSPLPGRIRNALEGRMKENAWIALRYALLLAVFGLSVLSVVSGSYNPFIYSQF